MTDMEFAIAMARAGRQVAECSRPAAEQMLADLVTGYPDLPWKMAVTGLHESSQGYDYARCVLISLGLL